MRAFRLIYPPFRRSQYRSGNSKLRHKSNGRVHYESPHGYTGNTNFSSNNQTLLPQLTYYNRDFPGRLEHCGLQFPFDISTISRKPFIEIWITPLTMPHIIDTHNQESMVSQVLQFLYLAVFGRSQAVIEQYTAFPGRSLAIIPVHE